MAEPSIYRATYGSGRTGILQQAVLEANRGVGSASFRTMGSTFTPNAGKIESDLMDLKVRMGMEQATRDPGGMSGRAFKALYPTKHAALQNNVLDRSGGLLRKQIAGAALTGDREALSAAQKAFTETMKTGGGRFRMAMPTRLMLNANWSTTKMGARAGMGAVRGANVASKAVLGASLGQVGFAAAVVGGIGYGIGNALGITGPQAAQAASAVHETFKQMNKPVYGYSELGQSTQGLVFGLNSRRTR